MGHPPPRGAFSSKKRRGGGGGGGRLGPRAGPDATVTTEIPVATVHPACRQSQWLSQFMPNISSYSDSAAEYNDTLIVAQ